MTDAGHLLSDLLSFIVAIIAQRLARRPATQHLSFGYYRAGEVFYAFASTTKSSTEVLSAVLSILIIWLLTGVLVYEAIERCIYMDFELRPKAMIATASAAVVFNLMCVFRSLTDHFIRFAHLEWRPYCTGAAHVSVTRMDIRMAGTGTHTVATVIRTVTTATRRAKSERCWKLFNEPHQAYFSSLGEYQRTCRLHSRARRSAAVDRCSHRLGNCVFRCKCQRS